jgi:serine/threonine protein kinase
MTSDFAGWAYGSFGRLGPGSRIGGYLIEEQIGAGGMAVVFRARHEVLGRLAAVKVITPSMAGDEAFRARFLRESRAAAAVDSPHIIPVYEAGEAEGLLYIAMQLAAGGDLADLARQAGGWLSPEQAASFVSQMAMALDSAHAAGLVHRDVTPRNVLVDMVAGQPGHVYLSDFGLSKGTQSTGLTATGEFPGTPDYCAPEQISGDHADGQADQYSLGCLAFALLTGEPPFRRPEVLATLYAHLTASVPPVTELRPELPPAIDGVIARALAKSAADRYGTCGEFAAALQEALTPTRDTAALESTEGNGGLAAPDGDQGRRRGKARALCVVGAAVLLAAGIAATIAFHLPPLTSGSAGKNVAYRVLLPSKYGFRNPWNVAAYNGHVWVVNSQSNSLTELNASNGALIRTVAYGKYGFSFPDGIASDGAHIWVVNNVQNGAVIELNARDGSWIRTLSGRKYGFNEPEGIVAEGGHVWVINSVGNSVTELNASDGSWIRTLSGAKYDFSNPEGIVADSSHIWVTNSGGYSVTELNASDGSWIRTLSGRNYGFNSPVGIAADSGHIWVTNPNSDSVTELNASDGSWIRTLSGAKYDFSNPVGITADSSHIWVTSTDRSSVTELNASDGSWVRTLSDSKYSLSNPVAIADDGTHLWVVSPVHSSVTEFTIG